MASTEIEIDVFTNRPREANPQYTELTNVQIKNIRQKGNAFFTGIDRTLSITDKFPKEGGRFYRDHYTDTKSEHLIRGKSCTQPFAHIVDKWSRYPSPAYDTCRGRAAVRWGVNKQGERTRSHFFGESHDRYTNIDMYRRNATCYPGRVIMDCGRPGDGYYTQKNPSRTTWFGSEVPLNQTLVMESVYRKPRVAYNEIREAEVLARTARKSEWPKYSEFTDKYLIRTKLIPVYTQLEKNKAHVRQEIPC